MVSQFRGAAALGLIAFLCLTASGCGRDDLGMVSGTVKLDGQPVADVFVEFVPQGPGSTASGRTDENGEYSLMFSLTVEGASIGENLVRISTYDVDVNDYGAEISIPERVPARYNHDSELLVTVESGSNRFDFDLVTAGVEIVQPTYSGDPPDDLGIVRGTVTLDGLPLANASIEFVPEGDSGSPSTGLTDANGDYSMMFTCYDEGAAIGATLVRITKRESLDEVTQGNSDTHTLPAHDVVDSELRVTVESGSHRFDLDLRTVDGEIVLPK